MVAIRARLENRETTGTGLLCDPWHVATCAHVAGLLTDEGQSKGYRSSLNEPAPSGLVAYNQHATIEVSFDPGDEEGWIEIAGYPEEDRMNDLAIVRLPRPFYGIAFPPIAGGGRLAHDTQRIAFGHQCKALMHSEARASGTKTMNGPGGAYYTAIHLGDPQGFSGGPVFLEQDGIDRLEGLTSIGGLASATGVVVSFDRLRLLLERLPGWRPLEEQPRQPGSSTLQTGHLSLFDIPLGERRAMTLRWADPISAWRALRPICAGAAMELKSGRAAAGANRVPYDAAGPKEAEDLVETLRRKTQAPLRLPMRSELEALCADRSAQAGRSVSSAAWTGLPLLMRYFDEEAWPGTPVESCEWARDGDAVRLFRRDEAHDRIVPCEPGGGQPPRSVFSQIRRVVRPILDGSAR
ncbi:trypsin-like peptidase domain-containing protein [Fulvimarina endophytica]|uniref:trypsin-like peptidase domain-containing protein n=1 Tax=Fulvimarina endophytica TaxID=2293836 RepID=UPI0018F6BF54|nr:trypsin-like peptidase domain-containing protein [Fulvimarina endophytica]